MSNPTSSLPGFDIQISEENSAIDSHLNFFGFNKNPFPVVPDAETFFITPSLDILVNDILHCIHTRKGFMVITGEVGLGKTTLSRTLLNALESEEVVSGLVLNTYYQGIELLKMINRDFGIQVQDGMNSDPLDALNLFLMDTYRQGKNCVLLIDDAQNLSIESLELIRMISTLETETVKLIQVLLIGQPELLEKLNLHQLRQLKSRIVLHVEVLPYTLRELEQYVYFKLNAVGGSGRISITSGSFKLLHRLTKGYPRLVNSLMDRCLYGLVAFGTTCITSKILKEVAKEVGLKDQKSTFNRSLLSSLNGLMTVVVVIFAMLLVAGVMVGLSDDQTLIWMERYLEKKGDVSTYKVESLADTKKKTPLKPKQHPPQSRPESDFFIPEQIRYFLQHDDLVRYRRRLHQALKEGRLESIAQQIENESGYLLVVLQRLPHWALSYKNILMYQPKENQDTRYILLWKPILPAPTLTYGLFSEAVGVLQHALSKLGFYTGVVDGIVGYNTLSALATFQRKNHLPQTMKPDSAAWFLLSHATKPVQWVLQMSINGDQDHAKEMRARLISNGFPVFVNQKGRWQQKEWLDITWAGPWMTKKEAISVAKDLKKAFQMDTIVRESKLER